MKMFLGCSYMTVHVCGISESISLLKSEMELFHCLYYTYLNLHSCMLLKCLAGSLFTGKLTVDRWNGIKTKHPKAK